MNRPSISSQDWTELYEAALQFRNIESWNWMEDSDLFGVQNPSNGEVNYCCVLGALGEVLGLTVYLGPEGLDAYLKMQADEVPFEDISVLYIQKCLLASFEDRKDLQKPDLQVIRSLGLKIRGPRSWPLFRSYRPGYLPWYLSKEEVTLLTIALQQAKEVTLRLRDNKDLLTRSKEGHYLTRVAGRSGEGWKWRDEWLKPSLLERKEIVIPAIDEVRLQRIKRTLLQGDGIWEADFFHAPMPVHEGERPYFPYMFVVVDRPSGLILLHHVASLEEYLVQFQNQFLHFIEENKSLPGQVMVCGEAVYNLLDPISSNLGINLVRTKKLREVEKVKKHLEGLWLSGK